MSSSSSAPASLSSSSLKDLLKICRSHNILLPDILPKDKQYYVDLIMRHRRETGREIVATTTTSSSTAVFLASASFRGSAGDGEDQAAGSFGAPPGGVAGGDEDDPFASSQEGGDWDAQMAASQRALAALRAGESTRREGEDDYVQVDGDDNAFTQPAVAPPSSYPHVQMRLRPSSRANSSSSATPAFPLTPSSSIAARTPSAAAAASAGAAFVPLANAASASGAPVSQPVSRSSSASDASLSSAAADDGEEDEEFVRSPAVQRITSILQDVALFDWLERRTGWARFYWFVGGVAAACGAILAWAGLLAVCNFICFVYPAYMTYKTLEGKFLSGEVDPMTVEGDASIEVHRYWLTYWCVYGIFKLVEVAADLLLYWIPYYDVLKVLFLVWCFHPSCQGCALVYRCAIRPPFLRREAAIDRGIDRALASARQAATEVRGIIVRKVAKRIAGEGETPVKQRQER